MSRIVDKRDVCMVSDCYGATIDLYKRGTLDGLIYGRTSDRFVVHDSGIELPEHLTTPDMIAAINTSASPLLAGVTVVINGVEVPPVSVSLGGDTYLLWGFKPQDFVYFKSSGT